MTYDDPGDTALERDRGTFVSTVLLLLYTTLGGVLGAGLTQYVTHISERRSARASVVERMAAIEMSYLDLRWSPVDHSSEEMETLYQSLDKGLAQLEATGLIAGVPRGSLIGYREACRMCADCVRQQRIVESTIERFEKNLKIYKDATDSLTQPVEIPAEIAEMAARFPDELMELADIRKTIIDTLKGLDSIRDSARAYLSQALWHPFLSILRHSEHRELERGIIQLESERREVSSKIRAIETTISR